MNTLNFLFGLVDDQWDRDQYQELQMILTQYEPYNIFFVTNSLLGILDIYFDIIKSGKVINCYIQYTNKYYFDKSVELLEK